MSMKLNSSIILTRDMDRSIRFYRGIMGLELEKQFDTVAFFQDGLVIHDEAVYVNYLRVPDPYPGGFRAVYYYIASDIDEMYGTLEEKKVAFIHGLETQPWGERCLRFYDPDGNVIEIGDGKS